jgi:hypothetical protein
MDLIMSQYHANQLSNIDNATRTEYDIISLQITVSGIKTNWLNVTDDAYQQIKQVLINMNKDDAK